MGNLKNMKDITKNVYWERNTKTRSNANIVGQVISKTTTDDFPRDAVTVRMSCITQKNPSISVYFYGATKTNTNYGWNYTDGKLIVFMTPVKGKATAYSFNGYTKMPMREIADYCEYIESEMANM